MTTLRPRDPVPLYYQLELHIRDEIEAGRLSGGDALPGENVLAEQFNVSRITVRRALDRLEEDGVIVRRRGARTVISAAPAGDRGRPDAEVRRMSLVFRGFEDELRRVGLQVQALLLESARGAAPPRIAALLEVPPAEVVVRIRRLGISHDTPLWLETRYFPPEIGERILEADPLSDSVLMLLRDKLNVDVRESRATLQAVVATPRQAQLLGVQAGSPLFRHQSVTLDSAQRPVQVVLVHLRGDLYRMDLQAVPRDTGSGLQLVGGGYVVDESLLDLE